MHLVINQSPAKSVLVLIKVVKGVHTHTPLNADAQHAPIKQGTQTGHIFYFTSQILHPGSVLRSVAALHKKITVVQTKFTSN